MKLIRGLHNLSSSSDEIRRRGCVVTVGNFDGVHKGHLAVIQQVLVKARQLNAPSVVMVFEPQPQEYFLKDKAPSRLMRFREKLNALKLLGLDYVVALQFNARLRALSAEAFVQDVLIDGLNIQHLVIGDDFRFGCDRAGDYPLLKQQGLENGFSVEPTQSQVVGGKRISSTRIRTLLESDDLDGAEQLLGHRYTISGCVIHGQKLGRQLGVPTANVFLGRLKPVLAGVYVVTTQLLSGKLVKGVANIGNRPTVGGVKPVLEVHLLDFNQELYGQHISVCFLAKVRNEQKFESLEALKQKIFEDIDQVKTFFETHPEVMSIHHR